MFDIIIPELLRGNQLSFLVQKCSPVKFTKVEMLAPNKVIRFTLNTGGIIKTVCKDGDTFSIETAFYVALAKYLSYRSLTPEGISAFAEELKHYKQAKKIVEAGIKTYERSVKEAEKHVAAEKEAKLIKERQRAKKIRYKERKKQKNDVK